MGGGRRRAHLQGAVGEAAMETGEAAMETGEAAMETGEVLLTAVLSGPTGRENRAQG